MNEQRRPSTVHGAPDPLLGVVLDGRWRIDAPLGAGGMGTVYRGRQLNIDRPAAIKIINPAGSDDALLLERFATEAHVIANLHHPHILRLFDVGQTPDGRPWIAMELLEGEPLSKRLARGAMPYLEALRVVRDVADALVEAHGHGIIHRDLKPANIFIQRVGDREVVKVLDFGIARVDDRHVTATGNVPGTPAYLSPEQARGEAVTAASDLYSLGVVAYECLTGALPFPGPSPIALLYQHVEVPPPPFAQRAPDVAVPAAVERAVLGLLSKNPHARPVSAAVLRDQIEALRARLSDPNAPALDPANLDAANLDASARPAAGAPSSPSPGQRTEAAGSPATRGATPGAAQTDPSPAAEDDDDGAVPSGRPPWLWPAAAVLLLGGALAWWQLRDAPSPGAAAGDGAPPGTASAPPSHPASTAPTAGASAPAVPVVDAGAPPATAVDAGAPDASPPDAAPPDARPKPDAAPKPDRPPATPPSTRPAGGRTPPRTPRTVKVPASAPVSAPASAPASGPPGLKGLRPPGDDEFLEN